MRDPASLSSRQKTFALITLIIALVLEIVDMTIVNTALPAIKASLGADARASQWIVAGYSLAFALLLMAGGRLGDSYGYRRMFVAGVIGFTLSSAACGMAATGTGLVAARLMQGATGAIMAPQSMALVQVLFSPLERVSRMAMFGVIGGLAAIAGPILGGMLIEANLFELGWRAVFLINLPVGIGAVIAGLMFLPEARSGRPAGYDFGGMGLFALAMGAVFWPLIGAGEAGRGGMHFLMLLAAAPLGWAAWRHVARRVRAGDSALFDPALFAIPTFRKGLALSVVFAAAGAGFLLVFAFALQAERGQTPLFTGLLHMPYGFGAMFGIGVMSRNFLPRLGRWVLVIGAGLMLPACLAVLYGATFAQWPWALIAALLVLSGAGMGMTSGCIGPIVVSQVPRDHAGAASALLKTSQQLGSALGVALVGSLYFAWSAAGHAYPALAAAGAIDAMLAICVVLALRLPARLF
ncbi:MFS transporter [Novosphingobium sp. KACC 22771]|uniref:MFS transporter n=1 Tax=Novosphingobium sp. KACC 22771 TaxID=3025670 RepID=UPI00236616FB|nr:MFS transporter [Novosphingobium sp. KACC 22771]WDF74769.1 MFS transporter [Novosphingobium sp. KACC 22771]